MWIQNIKTKIRCATIKSTRKKNHRIRNHFQWRGTDRNLFPISSPSHSRVFSKKHILTSQTTKMRTQEKMKFHKKKNRVQNLCLLVSGKTWLHNQAHDHFFLKNTKKTARYPFCKLLVIICFLSESRLVFFRKFKSIS